MTSQPEQLKARTKQFAIRVVRVLKSLPKKVKSPNAEMTQ